MKLFVIFQYLPGFCVYEVFLESSIRSSGDLNTLSLLEFSFYFFISTVLEIILDKLMC